MEEQQTERAERAGQTARTLRGFAALVLALCTTALMNGSLFPLFDTVFTFARDISVTFSAAALLALGFAAYRAPRLLGRRGLVAGAVACLAGGGALMIAGLAAASPAALCVGASAAALGRAVATVSVALFLTRLSSRRAALVIAAAYAVQLIAGPAAAAVPGMAGAVLFLAFPLAALALTAPASGVFFELARTAPSPSDLSVTRPASFLAPFSALFVCLFLFQVAFGFALRFDEVAGVPRVSALSAAPLVAVALYLGCTRRRFPADLLVQVSALVVMAGFLLAAQPLLGGAVGATGAADVALLNAGNGLFAMTAQVALVSIAARNPLGAVTTVSWGHGVTALGSLVGAAAGMAATGAAEAFPVLRAAIPAALLLVFAAYVLIGLKGFTFAGAIDGIEPVAPAGADGPAAQAPEAVFAERCDAIARQFALTPREAEVFAMLARGRDRAYIEAALVVSRNTVKAHVKHVYAKLGIHSHQELLDLVEG